MNAWVFQWCGAIFVPAAALSPEESGRAWPHLIGDSLVALAFYALPLLLLDLVRRRQYLPFRGRFLLATVFVAAGGALYLLELWQAWQPGYALSMTAKVAVAIIGFASALSLARVASSGLAKVATRESHDQRAQSRTDDLTAANAGLRHEVAQREKAEAEVRRLNTALEQRISELQTLFDGLPVGIGIATDPSCRAIRTNRAFAEMLSLSPEQNASLSAAEEEAPRNFVVLHQGQKLRPDELPMQRAVAENRAINDFEETIVRTDGTSIDVLVSAVPIRDEKGQACGCVATFQDITAHKQAERERREMERRLEESHKLESIGVLAGGIAHDFNNLLTGILGNAGLVRSQLPADAAQSHRLLSDVESSAMRAADLCKQLLAYAGKGRFVIQPLQLNKVVEQSTALLKRSLGKSINLYLDLANDLPECRGDSGQLRQAILNLVTNASEAMGENPGAVTIRTRHLDATERDFRALYPGHNLDPGPCVSIEVSDTGLGISAETLTRVFEPFFTTKFIGRGLGLPAVLGIVRGHRGGISIHSEPGRGTTVRMLFPATPTATSNSVPPILPEGQTRPNGAVLVVDDEDAVRDFAARALTAAGFTVVTARDGNEALAEVRADPTKFDTILLDLTMPRLDGEDTLEAVRLIAPNVSVVLTSGYSEQAVTARFSGRGIADFLPKPFTADQAVTCIRTVVEKRWAATR